MAAPKPCQRYPMPSASPPSLQRAFFSAFFTSGFFRRVVYHIINAASALVLRVYILLVFLFSSILLIVIGIVSTLRVSFASNRPGDSLISSITETELPRQLSLGSRRRKKMTLVLDLDETLVHSTFQRAEMCDLEVRVNIDNTNCVFYVLKRPHLDLFLSQLYPWFEIVVFTASLQKYADPLINMLDTHGMVDRRFFREHCVKQDGNFVKDLGILKKDLSKVILIDNSPASYQLHEDNAIPIEGWYNDPQDTELLTLIPLLLALRATADVRSLLRLRKHRRLLMAPSQR
eukprot:GILK01009974.1.p1 GENE.GILK01009974.1~~GILK01009974.1.p1  ORF type:complete len:289 (+),score=23.17 GILK01009974.1:61-927(+)